MRRSLTANGAPLVQAAQVSNTILDLNASDVDDSAVLLVTLFCYIVKNATLNTRVTASIVTDSASIIIGRWDDDSTAASNTFTQYRDKGVGAAKVLDRVPMRGNQQLDVATTAFDGAAVLWYGYYERVGIAAVPAPIRSLQPGALVSPFNALPVLVTSPAAGATQTVTVHQLDSTEERVDLLTLYAYCESSIATTGSPTCRVLVPGGSFISLPILEVPGNGIGGQPVKIYNGIPVRAPTSADNLFQIEVVADATAVLTTVVYGSFSRA
ncbi:MAG: hypothetical protein ACE1ZA_11285 [Pseudomonadales bacterium]